MLRRSVGRFHPDGARAHALLTEEGFKFEGCIDIFDAGPTMVADIDALKAVRESGVSRIAAIGPCEDGREVLACLGKAEAFRASRGRVWNGEDGLKVSAELAQALNVKVGDHIRHVDF
jgi:arginine N-succinyltransferase